MRSQISICSIFALVFGIICHYSQAEDLIKFTNGNTVRCHVTRIHKGQIFIKDSNGQEKNGTMNDIETIDFDIFEQQDSKQINNNLTIERLTVFPENYIGKSFTFAQVNLFQKLNKPHPIANLPNIYSLSLKSSGGEYSSGVILPNKLTFVVDQSMADVMSKDIQGGHNWPNTTISCTIKAHRTTSTGRATYLAIVDEIKIYNFEGEVEKIYKTKNGK